MLALIAALPRELEGVVRRMTDVRRARLGDGTVVLGALRGRSVAAAACGVGEARARQAAEGLFGTYPVHAMVSLGFAGSLSEEVGVGALVLPTQLRLDGEGASLEPDAALLGALQARAAAEGWPARRGVGVTAGRMVSAPEARRRLAERTGACVVDMEGYWLARACAANGVPYAGVRAVSDTLHDHHPVLERALRDGTLRLGRAARGYAGRPWELLKLRGLARGARSAARALEGFVAAAVAAAEEAA